jgi:hypothetical protein
MIGDFNKKVGTPFCAVYYFKISETGIKIVYPRTNSIGAKVIEPLDKDTNPMAMVMTPITNNTIFFGLNTILGRGGTLGATAFFTSFFLSGFVIGQILL